LLLKNLTTNKAAANSHSAGTCFTPQKHAYLRLYSPVISCLPASQLTANSKVYSWVLLLLNCKTRY